MITGYEKLPRGVVPYGVVEITYTPDTNFFGDDSFSFVGSDCFHYADSVGSAREFEVEVLPVPDPPRAGTLSVNAEEWGDSVILPIGEVVANVDRTRLVVRFVDSGVVFVW